MGYSRIEFRVDQGVARVTLNRPEVHNAFDAETIAELTDCFKNLSKDPAVRVVVLSGNGPNFCAGADLKWMKASVNFTRKQNKEGAFKMHKMLERIYVCPKPVVSRVSGIAFGGGVGLISVSDVVVCAADSLLSLSEVKLGILPAVISPFVIRKIGVSAFRAYGLSAKRITAEEALRIGMVQDVAPAGRLGEAMEKWIDLFLQNAPEAMATAKALSEKVRNLSISKAAEITVKTIAKARIGKEGQEGMKAFFEKRKPNWAAKS